jgi:hypothetical protein
MSTLSTVPATAGIARIAGVDIDQLLRDIGEASAQDSSTALFGLLLSAQQVLAQVQVDRAYVTTQCELSLLVMYRALNGTGRDYLIGMARQFQKSFPRQRTALTLVPTDRQGGAR